MNYTTSFKKESGKIIDQEHFKNVMLNLPDGEYHVIIENITDSTPENFRKMYFALLGQVSKYTGTDKNILHELRKSYVFIYLCYSLNEFF